MKAICLYGCFSVDGGKTWMSLEDYVQQYMPGMLKEKRSDKDLHRPKRA